MSTLHDEIIHDEALVDYEADEEEEEEDDEMDTSTTVATEMNNNDKDMDTTMDKDKAIPETTKKLSGDIQIQRGSHADADANIDVKGKQQSSENKDGDDDGNHENGRSIADANADAFSRHSNSGSHEDNSSTKRSRDVNGAATAIPAARNASTARSAKTIRSSNTSHGIYIPPFRRRRLLEQQKQEAEKQEEDGEINNKSNDNQNTVSIQDQRQKWEDLKKTINGTINRLNNSTIKELIHSLFQNANLIRGKGLLARSILRAATTSPTYAQVYASLVAVLNTKLPEIGELILVRSILTFRQSYARQDRSLTMSITNFIGCLFNQGICHELLCLQLLTVLLDGDPTDDSVEVAVQLTKVVGMALAESSPAGIHAVMERFRNLLHDGSIGRRVQYKIEELINIRKSRFKDYPVLVEDLDLVEREEQILFEISLDDEGLKKEEDLDVFKFDNHFVEHENDWIAIQKEILGEGSDDADTSGGSGGSETDDDDDDNDDESDGEDNEDGMLEQPSTALTQVKNNNQIVIHDMTEKDLINLRRKIYLTIMSSATFEECAHKLSKLSIPPGKEMELINMIIECCSQERTFLRYYGLIASRFCLLNQRWSEAFLEAFDAQYSTIHRLETNKLRNVAKLFAHLLHTDSLSWSCLSVIHLNEDETTSSSRIFLKILVQEMAEAIGIGGLVKRFETDDPEVMDWYKEMFPKDNPRKTRYAINFFTSIGLGPLTDGLREHLKNAPKLIMMQAEEEAKRRAIADASSDESSSVSSASSSSTSSISSRSSSSSSSSSSYSSTSTGGYSSSSSSSETSKSRRKGGNRRKRVRSKTSVSERKRKRDRSYSSSESESVSETKRKKKDKGERSNAVRHSASNESESHRRNDKKKSKRIQSGRSASYSSRSR